MDFGGVLVPGAYLTVRGSMRGRRGIFPGCVPK
jgi:hypothetical protein